MELTDRQAELADVVLEIIARDGPSAVSFRAVAGDSGWSLGAVQKAFPSKDTMLTAAFARLRMREVPLPPAVSGSSDLRSRLVALLLSMLPLDEQRIAAQRQGDAFAQRALSDPGIAAAIAESDDQIRGLLTTLVSRAQAAGEVAAAVDPEVTAWAVMAIAQGLATQLLYQPEPESLIRERLDATLAALLPRTAAQQP